MTSVTLLDPLQDKETEAQGVTPMHASSPRVSDAGL